LVLAVFCYNSCVVCLCLAAPRLPSREVHVRWPSVVSTCVVALFTVVVAKVQEDNHRKLGHCSYQLSKIMTHALHTKCILL